MPEQQTMQDSVRRALRANEPDRTQHLAICLARLASAPPNQVQGMPFEGTEQYIDSAREFVSTCIRSDTFNPGSFAKDATVSVPTSVSVRLWERSHATEIRNVATAHGQRSILAFQEQFAKVFPQTLHAFTRLPLTSFSREYDRKWRQMTSRVPESAMIARQALAAKRWTAKRILQTVADVEAIPHIMPLPIFEQLRNSDQEAVVDHVGKEWLGYLRLIACNADATQRALMMPEAEREINILHRPVHQLGVALQSRREPAKVVDEYFDRGSAFDEYYQEVTRRAPEHEQQLTHDEVIQSLQPGDTYLISGKDKVISIAVLERVVNVFVDAHAKKMQQLYQNASFCNWSTKSSDMVEKLKKGFNGNIQNARIVMLETSEEFIQKRTREGADPASVRRFALMADLKSTGRPAVAVSVDLALYARTSTMKPGICKTSATRITGDQAIKGLLRESAQIARECGRLTSRARLVGSGNTNVYQNEPSRRVIG